MSPDLEIAVLDLAGPDVFVVDLVAMLSRDLNPAPIDGMAFQGADASVTPLLEAGTMLGRSLGSVFSDQHIEEVAVLVCHCAEDLVFGV